MLLNRRTMLQASIGAVALSLTGCKNTKTVIVFVNNSSVALSVDAASNGKKFKKKNIQPGHTASQTYRSNDTVGTLVPVTGTATPAGGAPLNLAGLEVTLGKTNTFTVTDLGLSFPAPVVT